MSRGPADVPGWDPPISPPTVRSESDGGRLWRLSGSRVRTDRGRTWVSGTRGIWRPVAFLDPVDPGDVRFPSPTAIAVQGVVADPALATSNKPWVVFPDLADYGAARMAKVKRRDLRRALREFDYRVLVDPSLLADQGWEVASAAAVDSGSWTPSDETAYRTYVRALFDGMPPLVVAGTQEGRLAGYLMSYAIRDVAYLQDLYIAPWARTRNTGAGLYWLTLQAWRMVPGVTRASAGRALGTGVDAYKQTIGAQVVDLPLVTRIRRPVAHLLRRRRPDSLLLAEAGIRPRR